MRWLVRGAASNDSLFFHCEMLEACRPSFCDLLPCLDSGHGGQTKDTDGDEADGYDEGFSLFLHDFGVL